MGKEWTGRERARWDVAYDGGTGDHNIYSQSVVLRGVPDEREYQYSSTLSSDVSKALEETLEASRAFLLTC